MTPTERRVIEIYNSHTKTRSFFRKIKQKRKINKKLRKKFFKVKHKNDSRLFFNNSKNVGPQVVKEYREMGTNTDAPAHQDNQDRQALCVTLQNLKQLSSFNTQFFQQFLQNEFQSLESNILFFRQHIQNNNCYFRK